MLFSEVQHESVHIVCMYACVCMYVHLCMYECKQYKYLYVHVHVLLIKCILNYNDAYNFWHSDDIEKSFNINIKKQVNENQLAL